jgi:transcriptional regulator with XRE-family HTH domain
MAGAAQLQEFVGANTRRLREHHGWNQETLAQSVGTSARHLRDIESGNVNMTLETLALLAKALSVEAVELLRPARVTRRGPGRPKKKRTTKTESSRSR